MGKETEILKERFANVLLAPNQGGLAIERALRHLAALSAIDGAVVMNSKLELISFGTKLYCSSEDFDLLEVDVLIGGAPTHCPLKGIGGTRHQSAARFVYHHHEAIAFVLSQDRRITLFVWETDNRKVLAIRRIQHLIWEYDSLISI